MLNCRSTHRLTSMIYPIDFIWIDVNVGRKWSYVC